MANYLKKKARIRLAVIAVLIGFICPGVAQAQDSLRFYRKIKKVAYKNRFTRMAYEAVFVDPEPRPYPAPASKEEKHVNPYLFYQDIPIRQIHIYVLDPFGYSVTDTVPKKRNLTQKAGNALHITTRRKIIENRLLFKLHDSLDAIRLSETERVLRQAPFVNDARITVSANAACDSADVFVYVHDRWPVTVPSEITDVNANARFRNRNVLGSGNQFEQYAAIDIKRQVVANGFFNLSNIGHTYISSQVAWQYAYYGTDASINFDRPFYSPLTNWAAGLNVTHSWRTFTYYDNRIEAYNTYPLNTLSYDAHIVRGIKPSGKGIFSQSTNWLLGARHFQRFPVKHLPRTIDSVNLRNSGVLVNAGFSLQQFFKDKYIYRFGANEDVPEGLLMQVTAGIVLKEKNEPRFYNGFEIARAKNFRLGYLTATASMGVYYNHDIKNDVTVNFQLYYFSNLVKLNRWYFRQFFNYKYVTGINKLNGALTTLSADELYGFNGNGLWGTTKMLFTSETVAYMPYNVVGFRIAPVLMAGAGVVYSPSVVLDRSRIFQGYSLGLLFRNENLLTSTFQVSVGFYPYLPDGTRNIFKYNPVTSFTLRVRGFSVSRPEFVPY